MMHNCRSANGSRQPSQYDVHRLPNHTHSEERLFSDPLTAEHRRELSAARGRGKTIRKAARVAAFNGWTTALIAAVSAPFSIGSPVGLALTAGIAVVAINEFRGRKQLLNFEPRGATLLGWNQLGFLAMIIVYCLWMLQQQLERNGRGRRRTEGLRRSRLRPRFDGRLRRAVQANRHVLLWRRDCS